jgi:hypothetical protein
MIPDGITMTMLPVIGRSNFSIGQVLEFTGSRIGFAGWAEASRAADGLGGPQSS